VFDTDSQPHDEQHSEGEGDEQVGGSSQDKEEAQQENRLVCDELMADEVMSLKRSQKRKNPVRLQTSVKALKVTGGEKAGNCSAESDSELMTTQYTRNVTRNITQSVRDLETEVVELQGLVDSMGDRGFLESLTSKKGGSGQSAGRYSAAWSSGQVTFSGRLSDRCPVSIFFSGLEKKNGQKVDPEGCWLSLADNIKLEVGLSGGHHHSSAQEGRSARAEELEAGVFCSVLTTRFCLSVQRGVRQGCSLSGMLYSLAIEPLLHKLRKDLCGVCFPGCDHFKLSAYADNVTVMVNNQRDIC
ncbi:hypothetical protein L3Q82_019096, partial [Scortum barcoo]